MGPTLPPTNLDVLLLMGRVPGSSGVAASRYEFILIILCHRQIELTMALEAVAISCPWLEMAVRRSLGHLEPTTQHLQSLIEI